MPTAQLKAFLAMALAVGLAAAAPARATDEPRPAAKPTPASEPRTAPPPHPTTAGGTPAEVLDQAAVQGIIGRTVKSATGEDMGRIVDFLVSPTGDVRAAVLDFGGVLGVGSRRVAVSWKALSFGNVAKDGFVEVKLTRNQIRMAPEMKNGDPVVVLEPPPEPPAHAATPAPQALDPHAAASQAPAPTRAQPSAAPEAKPAGSPETKK